MDYEDHIHKLQANGAPSPSSSLLAAPLRQHFVLCPGGCNGLLSALARLESHRASFGAGPPVGSVAASAPRSPSRREKFSPEENRGHPAAARRWDSLGFGSRPSISLTPRREKEACETRHCVKKKQAIFDQGARYCTEPRLPKSPSGKYYFFAHFEENFSVASSRFPFCRIRTLFTHSSIVLPAFGGWFNVIQEETRRIRKKKEKKRGSGEKGKSNCVRCVRVQCPSGCCLSCSELDGKTSQSNWLVNFSCSFLLLFT
ncbi:hypothetical protein HZ326_23568 [Fusarium oxysporum f. sp. albedinis]|nr:hypothetical protein HZ326_23568 [Fusarium oxysporum f. sp. albedinis]